MSKLTKKQRTAIEYALRNAERAFMFIQSGHIVVARKGGPATTTLHYARADGSTLYEIDKQIGSDLTGLENTIKALSDFLMEYHYAA